MRSTTLAAVALAALLGAAGPARAQDVRMFYDGNQLLAFCESDNPSDQGRCSGFIVAVTDTLAAGDYAGWQACIPLAISIREVREVVVRELRAHPEDLHVSATSFVARALDMAFPCSAAPQQKL